MTLPLSWKWTIVWKMALAYSGILWCTHATQFLYSGQETALSVYQQWVLYCSISFPSFFERHNELSTRGCCFIVTGFIIIHVYISHSDHVCLQKGFVSREKFVSKDNSLKKIIPYQIFNFFFLHKYSSSEIGIYGQLHVRQFWIFQILSSEIHF